MSMNLCFHVKGGGYVDFPFQTPTKLSYSVFKAGTKEEKLRLIKLYLQDCEDREWVEQLLSEIKKLLNNPNLELVVR